MQPDTCFNYSEHDSTRTFIPSEGMGFCLKSIDAKRNCVACREVIEAGRCPKGRLTPYLKEGERS